MPRDAVSRTANVERNGGHKWVKNNTHWRYFLCVYNKSPPALAADQLATLVISSLRLKKKNFKNEQKFAAKNTRQITPNKKYAAQTRTEINFRLFSIRIDFALKNFLKPIRISFGSETK